MIIYSWKYNIDSNVLLNISFFFLSRILRDIPDKYDLNKDIYLNNLKKKIFFFFPDIFNNCRFNGN